MDPTLKAKTISTLKDELPNLSPRLKLVAKYIVDHSSDFGLDPHSSNRQEKRRLHLHLGAHGEGPRIRKL